MTTFVAMLRSINVGGRNRVAMADLRAVADSLGYGDVSTYLQSGNLVFVGSGSPAEIGRSIEEQITSELGLTVPVVVRTKVQLGRVLRDNPFALPDLDAKTVHVTFLAERADAHKVAQLQDRAGQFGNDRFEVIGGNVYLHCPGGYGETKLNNSYLEGRLGVTGTTRNWRTVTALASMTAELR
jgi:uncharacterized protein (DUF1697 family)